MGKKAKGSRKGKKAWRANISTDDIDDYFVESTKDANTGGSLSSVPDHSLFFLDKADVAAPPPPPKSGTERHREKVLHVDRVLQKNPFVQPIPSSKSRLQKRKRTAAPTAPRNSEKDGKDASELGPLHDIWDAEDVGTGKGIKKPVAAHIPAVEVDSQGCSFNPPFEAHQDSLAQAVAFEIQKSYKKELEPQPIPYVVCEEIDDEERYFLEADNDEEADEDGNEEPPFERQRKRKRVTRVELNRRARRKERIKGEVESQKVKKLLKEIDSLPDILDEISKDDEEKERKHVRRVVALQERLKSGPPRLGKHKFEPAPPQVLLSEEISGSLRKLKGCCTLASDRFKSLEKRGFVVPGSKRSRN